MYVGKDQKFTAQEIAELMHQDAVDLWNAYWRENGERDDFPQREAVEALQRSLATLAWPTVAA